MKKTGTHYIFSLLVGLVVLPLTGCDRLYGLLHKAGGEERQVLGAFEFNEYNPNVENLQKILRAFGYMSGHADGKFGATTREAVARFQKDEGLTISRFVDKATWERMQAYLNCGLFKKMELNPKAIQEALQKAGFFAGKTDGRLGPRTREALKAFQSAKGLVPDGYIGLHTIKALAEFSPQGTYLTTRLSKPVKDKGHHGNGTDRVGPKR